MDTFTEKKKPTFLIVDDSILMRNMIRMYLNSFGFEIVAEAEDGIEAIQKYIRSKPDIVTMDITMPRMDGISAIKKIIKYDPTAKIIVCSAAGEKENIIQAIRAGAKDFLIKPLQQERIITSIKLLS